MFTLKKGDEAKEIRPEIELWWKVLIKATSKLLFQGLFFLFLLIFLTAGDKKMETRDRKFVETQSRGVHTSGKIASGP